MPSTRDPEAAHAMTRSPFRAKPDAVPRIVSRPRHRSPRRAEVPMPSATSPLRHARFREAMTKPIPALTPLVIELAASAATSQMPPVVVATGDLGSRSHLPPSDRAVAVHPPCGVRLGFGERIVGLGATDPFLVVPGGAWAGATLGTDLAIATLSSRTRRSGVRRCSWPSGATSRCA